VESCLEKEAKVQIETQLPAWYHIIAAIPGREVRLATLGECEHSLSLVGPCVADLSDRSIN